MPKYGIKGSVLIQVNEILSDMYRETMEYYSAIPKEQNSHIAAKYMELEDIMLVLINQAQKDKKGASSRKAKNSQHKE